MSNQLGGYAVNEQSSRGRTYPEKPHPYRSAFERDRDRIIHCSAFRRLEGKTQVFTPGLDDYYRTRLTHSIEVAQIGRTIAKALSLNESLTEAICLAHDLGHCPFGHAGEEALDGLMRQFGGFEHNRQSLRIVELLEHPYPDFPGLNLMYETRLGLSKHSGPYDRSADTQFAEANCSLEGQAADTADRIAYNCHDLEDGMRAGLIEGGQMIQIRLFREAQQRIHAEQIEDRMIQQTRTAKTIIDTLVSDCIETGRKNIADLNITAVEPVYQHAGQVISLSGEYEARLSELERFLLERFYRHRLLMQTAKEVSAWLSRLFEKICRKPALMPKYFLRFTESHGLERTVCDYIAGMTDRYCLKMFEQENGGAVF